MAAALNASLSTRAKIASRIHGSRKCLPMANPTAAPGQRAAVAGHAPVVGLGHQLGAALPAHQDAGEEVPAHPRPVEAGGVAGSQHRVHPGPGVAVEHGRDLALALVVEDNAVVGTVTDDPGPGQHPLETDVSHFRPSGAVLFPGLLMPRHVPVGRDCIDRRSRQQPIRCLPDQRLLLGHHLVAEGLWPACRPPPDHGQAKGPDPAAAARPVSAISRALRRMRSDIVSVSRIAQVMVIRNMARPSGCRGRYPGSLRLRIPKLAGVGEVDDLLRLLRVAKEPVELPAQDESTRTPSPRSLSSRSNSGRLPPKFRGGMVGVLVDADDVQPVGRPRSAVADLAAAWWSAAGAGDVLLGLRRA